MNARVVATWTPILGAGLAGWLGWGLMHQRNYWAASDFVLLFYGTLLCVAAAQVASAVLRRRGMQPPPPLVRELLFLLSACALVAVLWVWCTPVLQPVVGWWTRQITIWKFGW
jgi:uncharacterized membrane protein YoaK (UPF0700 family)